MFYKKKKRIEELEAELKGINRNADTYRELYSKEKEERKELEKQIKGERVAGRHCSKCIHVITDNCNYYSCELDCNCKDYEK